MPPKKKSTKKNGITPPAESVAPPEDKSPAVKTEQKPHEATATAGVSPNVPPEKSSGDAETDEVKLLRKRVAELQAENEKLRKAEATLADRERSLAAREEAVARAEKELQIKQPCQAPPTAVASTTQKPVSAPAPSPKSDSNVPVAPNLAPPTATNSVKESSVPVQKEKPALTEPKIASAPAEEKPCSKAVDQAITSRVENLKPGEAFAKQWKEWSAIVSSWKQRQLDWNNPTKKNTLLAKKLADLKSAAKGGGEVKVPSIDPEDLDVFSVEDVMDIGSGEPLFANFEYEDWALLALRYELHLLVHSFRKDTRRAGFLEADCSFYYSKYFHKQLATKTYNCESLKDLAKLIKESIRVSETDVLETLLAEDAPFQKFAQIVEDHRRDRQRRVDAGFETAELKFVRQAVAHPPSSGPKASSGPKPPATLPPQKRAFSPGNGPIGSVGKIRPPRSW